MSDFIRYQLAKANRRAAHAEYNHASVALRLAQIEERLAEIQSQHEPLGGLLAQDTSNRDKLIAAARYVVIGRPVPEAPAPATLELALNAALQRFAGRTDDTYLRAEVVATIKAFFDAQPTTKEQDRGQ